MNEGGVDSEVDNLKASRKEVNDDWALFEMLGRCSPGILRWCWDFGNRTGFFGELALEGCSYSAFL